MFMAFFPSVWPSREKDELVDDEKDHRSFRQAGAVRLDETICYVSNAEKDLFGIGRNGLYAAYAGRSENRRM